MIYGIEYENSGWGNEEELDRARWDAKHEAPLTGDKALPYADDQPACLIAAYRHGETEDEMLALLRAHIAECVHCDSPDGSAESGCCLLRSGKPLHVAPRGVNPQPIQTAPRRTNQ